MPTIWSIAFCKFRFLGFTAISYVKGVTGGSIRNCEFRWLSGNGIVIHDDGNKNPAAGDACQNIRIVNNGITRYRPAIQQRHRHRQLFRETHAHRGQ